MGSPFKSIIASGTKLWLDSIDPDLVAKNRALGATGATSNPIIVSDLIKTGRFDDQIAKLIRDGLDDEAIAWGLTDSLVSAAQGVFLPVWEQTRANDGYVSFELDPLLEDAQLGPSHERRVAKYIELGKRWSANHKNRMIKIPATPAGLDAVEEIVASGITVNVTLIFSERQYKLARDAAWRGAQRRPNLDGFKSVYSIFVSRVDVYTQKHAPQLSQAAQGLVGIVNAKRIWSMNQAFWADKKLPLQQEMIFASTGTKNADDPSDKYVASFVGSDIETNPPATNDLVEAGGKTYTSQIEQMPPADVLAEIDREVDVKKLEETLMAEGLAKFADPQKSLIALIADKRRSLSAAA
jgi:transaldolase